MAARQRADERERRALRRRRRAAEVPEDALDVARGLVGAVDPAAVAVAVVAAAAPRALALGGRGRLRLLLRLLLPLRLFFAPLRRGREGEGRK